MGFVRTPDGVIKKFHDPSFYNTIPAGINDSGVIVGNLQTSPGPNVGFMRTADGTITTYNLPDADGSMEGINNSNVIVGFYYKKSIPYDPYDGPFAHGFIVTP